MWVEAILESSPRSGPRGFPTYVQYDLGKNGANGIYSATMGSSHCQLHLNHQ